MRIVLISLLFLAGCDLPAGPATPAPTGISANSHGGDTRFGGADQNFSAKGSERVISIRR